VLETSHPGIFAYLRQAGTETILVLVNLTGETISDYGLSAPAAQLADGTYRLQTLFGAEAASSLTVTQGQFKGYAPLPLKPFETFLAKLER
jgi:hypothetical protein